MKAAAGRAGRGETKRELKFGVFGIPMFACLRFVDQTDRDMFGYMACYLYIVSIYHFLSHFGGIAYNHREM